MRILSFGSDPGTLLGPDHHTYRRHMSYARRLEWLGMITYSPPGREPVMSQDVPFRVFPSNSLCRPAYLIDALVLGSRIIKRYRVRALVSQDAFAFGLVAYVLSRLHRIPLVVHFHADMLGNPYWLKEKPSHRLLYVLGRFIAGRAHVIRTVSTKIRDDLIRMGYPARKIHYVSPPVNPHYARQPDPQAMKTLMETYSLAEDRVFVSIGRLSYQKNYAMLLKAVALLRPAYPGLKVLVLGEGPERDRLIALRDRLGLAGNVLFPGTVPNRALVDFFGISLALILTSVYEGTAKVIKEAAFAGRPAISTDTSGVSDAIRDRETGLIVPQGEVTALAEAMEVFLKDPERSRIMGGRARDYISGRFDYERDVDALVEVWKAAAEEGIHKAG